MLEKDRPGKLFVGGLAEDIDEKSLEREFSKFGRITEALVIRDKLRQVCRGFGFVTYENPIDAEEAVKHMDGKEVHGKKLHVEDAVRGGIMSQDSGRFSRDGGGYGGFRGRGRGGPPRGGRGGPPRGRGGFPPRDGPPRGGFSSRGGSYSRGGRGGGGIMSSRYDDESPPRSSMMGRGPGRGRNGYDSGRGRPMSSFDSRRDDRYDSGGFSERGPPPRSRDPYGSSPPRDSGRGPMDSRLGLNRTSRDYPPTSRDYPPSSREYPPSREYQSLNQREYSPERGAERYSYRDSYATSRSEDRGDGYGRSSGSRGEYMGRSEMRDFPRDSYNSRGGGDSYSMSTREYREPLTSRGGDRFESRDYDMGGGSSSRFSREMDSRGPPRDSYMSRETGPPSRGYAGSSGMSGSRGPPTFSSSRPYPPSGMERRSSGDRDSFSSAKRRPSGPPPPRGGPPPTKRPRSDGPPSRGPPPPSFRR